MQHKLPPNGKNKHLIHMRLLLYSLENSRAQLDSESLMSNICILYLKPREKVVKIFPFYYYHQLRCFGLVMYQNKDFQGRKINFWDLIFDKLF